MVLAFAGAVLAEEIGVDVGQELAELGPVEGSTDEHFELGGGPLTSWELSW